MSILIDNFLGTFGGIFAIVVWGLIVFIVIALIATIFGENKKDEDKKDEFDWTYQDEKCFNFAYGKDNSYKQVCISKKTLISLIEDKNIDLYYEDESK